MVRSAAYPAPSTSGVDGETRGASAILNVIELLRCFTVDSPLQGVTEMATKVGLHKSSVSRILATLEQADIVERDEGSRKFRLGLGLIAVAGPLLANLEVRRLALPLLQELSTETGETIALTVWSGYEAVTVEQVPSERPIKQIAPLGTRYDEAMRASVQVFLAEMPAERAAALLRSGMPSLPARGSTDLDAYLVRLATSAVRGYAVNFGETSPEEVGIAAPVRDRRGTAVAAVVLAAPFYRVAESAVPGLGTACAKTAAQISTRLCALPS